jgi:hypothetical protein
MFPSAALPASGSMSVISGIKLKPPLSLESTINIFQRWCQSPSNVHKKRGAEKK